MKCPRRSLDNGTGKLVGELLQRIMAQRLLYCFREQLPALARQMVRHVAELKLNQEISHLGFLDEILNAPINGFRAADDDRLRGVELLPIFHIAEKFSARYITFEVFSPRSSRNIGNPRPVGQLAPFTAQVPLETILQKVPNTFLALVARLLIRLGDVGRHQNAEAKRLVSIAVFFQNCGEFLLRAMSFTAMAAGREKIAVAALGDFDHGRRTARAWYPDRRKWFLQRFRPKVYVAEWKVVAFVSEGTVLGPGADDQIGCFPEFFSRICGWHIVIESFRSAPGGEASAVAHLIEHRVFLGHAHGIHMQGKEIAEDDNLSTGCSLRQRRGDDVGRGHQAVNILMVFVKYHAVETQFVGVSELVDVFLVQAAGFVVVPQAIGNRDPARVLLLVEILIEIGISHEMPAEELNRLHCLTSFVRIRRDQSTMKLAARLFFGI